MKFWQDTEIDQIWENQEFTEFRATTTVKNSNRHLNKRWDTYVLPMNN